MTHKSMKRSALLATVAAIALLSPATDVAAQQKAAAAKTAMTGVPDMLSVKDRLKAHVKSIDGGTAGEYALSLSRLRAQRKEAAIAAAELYRDAPKADLVGRWGLVMTMGELHSTEAVPTLRQIALEPLPNTTPDPKDAHAWSPDADEFSIRIRAMAGLGQLAAGRNTGATAALRACVRSPNRGLRATAVYELLESTRRAGGDVPSVRSALAAQLVPGDAWMLNMRTGDRATDGGVILPPETLKNDGLVTPAVRR